MTTSNYNTLAYDNTYHLYNLYVIYYLCLKLSAQPYGQPNAKYVHFCTCTIYLMCT